MVKLCIREDNRKIIHAAARWRRQAVPTGARLRLEPTILRAVPALAGEAWASSIHEAEVWKFGRGAYI